MYAFRREFVMVNPASSKIGSASSGILTSVIQFRVILGLADDVEGGQDERDHETSGEEPRLRAESFVEPYAGKCSENGWDRDTCTKICSDSDSKRVVSAI